MELPGTETKTFSVQVCALSEPWPLHKEKLVRICLCKKGIRHICFSKVHAYCIEDCSQEDAGCPLSTPTKKHFTILTITVRSKKCTSKRVPCLSTWNQGLSEVSTLVSQTPTTFEPLQQFHYVSDYFPIVNKVKRIESTKLADHWYWSYWYGGHAQESSKKLTDVLTQESAH